MPLYEITLLSQEQDVESICDALEALDALSVSVEDAQGDTEFEDALFGEPGMPAPKNAWQHSKVKALFATKELALQAENFLAQQPYAQRENFLGITAVEEQDWVRLTQSQFEPVLIAPGFYIVPSWHEKPVDAVHAIELDPGLAFGTGTHPTTRMCLQWLAKQDLRGKRVLDYGCGSGILAIAAAKLGAAEVVAVDIDSAAVEATNDNALKNQVQLFSGLPDMASERRQGGYDVVIANILSSPLKVLAPLLGEMCAAGGNMVLSGILERQTVELQDAYAPFVAIRAHDNQEGWVLMCTN